MAHIELLDITKVYGNHTAVAGISLRVEQGEFLALLGPSGCGKTTTLQMLAGFVEPTSGDIVVGMKTMRGVPSHKRNIGVMFQSYALFPHMSVFDNVAFGLKMRKVAPGEIATRVNRALDLVQLNQLGERFPRQLSGGQQQRVALARAIVVEPSVLLLDEPLSNLDASLREQMRFEIREIQKRIGITTVFVTHDQNEAMAVADRLVVMSKGQIRQVGTPQEIYESPADVFVASFIGQANLLRGEVAQVGDGVVEVMLKSGQRVSARQTGPAQPGQPATLAVHPEDLQIAAAPPGGFNAVNGVVTRTSYLGSTFNIGVSVGDTALTLVTVRNGQIPRQGESVTVCWPPSAGILLVENA
ncbi:ABC transporter ATP-binding protein [Bosea sp. (in: a-proteobacteria)]|uniref:ABC transporter ATP-binding protein n=1 Tax=Bosea sp. (in: a-proteobacteria) TaxID=1871050 RepID=UPI00261B0463|nr:ABC transporter ATP-binding protein [Bosea sp. (in: a-proteobacteria)]MCO5089589.1 ABC transporter ATP-binding protein [Bosea sp. (in: a-proteobacteria)]